MRIFYTAKVSHIFSTKNINVFVIFTFEILTKRLLTTLLISNNRPLLNNFSVMLGRSHRFLGITSTFWGVNVPCSRTQHGLTRVGLEPPTSGFRVRGINHKATALPKTSSVAVQPSLCWTSSETLNTGFLMMRVIYRRVLPKVCVTG